MKIFLVGTGMDGGATLTAEAQAAVDSAEVIIGAKRVTEPFSGLGKPVFHSWKAAEIAAYLSENSFSEACVLLSGDCGFFSAAAALKEVLSAFPECEISLIPGISSPSYFAAKLKRPWQDFKLISLHGTKRGFVRDVCKNRLCFFLLGGEMTAGSVCRALCEYEMGELAVYVGEDLGGENEKISKGTASGFSDRDFSQLSVMLVENPAPERGAEFGIADSRFLRGEVPMTKAEIRAVIMSKLGVREGDICWDVGCGTGSVTVEMALQGGEVYAVDPNAEAVSLTGENARRFRCDNVTVIEGAAPETLCDLPKPDRVFVGGSGGALGGILGHVFEEMNPGARIVATAVTLKTLEVCRAEFASHGAEAEITQVSVSRVGAGTMLTALNPIFIIKGEKP